MTILGRKWAGELGRYSGMIFRVIMGAISLTIKPTIRAFHSAGSGAAHPRKVGIISRPSGDDLR